MTWMFRITKLTPNAMKTRTTRKSLNKDRSRPSRCPPPGMDPGRRGEGVQSLERAGNRRGEDTARGGGLPSFATVRGRDPVSPPPPLFFGPPRPGPALPSRDGLLPLLHAALRGHPRAHPRGPLEGGGQG